MVATASLGRFTYRQAGNDDAPVSLLDVARPAGCGSAQRTLAARVPTENVGMRTRRRGRVRGSPSTAGAHKTAWTTQERCDATITRVFEGEVEVRDHRTGAMVIVREGECYVAPSPVAQTAPCPGGIRRPRQ